LEENLDFRSSTTIVTAVAAGLEGAGEGRREGIDAARGMYRGREAGRERCKKLGRIGVMEDQI